LLVDLGPLRETLVREMRGRIKEDDDTVPKPDGPFAYFTRHREGGEYPLICREPREGGETAILLDGDKEGDAHSYFDLQDAVHSPDHKLLAWSADIAGSELYTIRVRDLATGDDMADEIRATSGEIVWCLDSRTFYYVEIDENHRPARVRRHRLGQPQSEDELIYEETEVGWFIDVDSTTSGAFVVIGINDHETSEVWLLDRADPKAERRLVAPARRSSSTTSSITGSTSSSARTRMERRTSSSSPPRWPIRRARTGATLSPTGRASWCSTRSHSRATSCGSSGRTPTPASSFARCGAARSTPSLPEEAYGLGLDAGYEFDTDTIRFGYSSMTTPNETYDYNLRTRERVLRKRQEIPSGFDSARYVTRRIFGTAPDGETVPISLVHRRDLKLDGTAPCLIYGYGSYGSSMSASFRTNLLSLVDRGFVYAIAHVRGGTEKGWRWYMDGKREKKTNTFRTSSSAPRP
jgi:oligopeptidase B